MATQMSPRRSFADEAAEVAAAAAATRPSVGAAPADRTKRKSRRGRMIVFSLIPIAAVALTAVSASVGLIGGKKTPAPTAAQQATNVLNAGLDAQAKGDVVTAANDYRQVLTLDPKNVFAYYNLGLLDQQAGRAAQAETEYRQALTIDPNFEVALFNLAILRTPPAPQEAVDLYRHAITLAPKDAGAHLNLGFLLESIGQRSEGIAELRLAVGIQPNLASRVPAADLAASTPAPAPAKR